MKASAYIAMSLDGFIARPNGGLDWLSGSENEDYGYEKFISTVDTIVLGRKSFEQVLSFGEWPYAGLRGVVLSRGLPTIPGELEEQVECNSLPPRELIDYLENSGAQHLYIDGGKTIQSFLSARLIQELTITVIPILIGDGIPLFGPLEQDIRLELLENRAYPDGLVQIKYRVVYA